MFDNLLLELRRVDIERAIIWSKVYGGNKSSQAIIAAAGRELP
jgi:hypothetical protein